MSECVCVCVGVSVRVCVSQACTTALGCESLSVCVHVCMFACVGESACHTWRQNESNIQFYKLKLCI